MCLERPLVHVVENYNILTKCKSREPLRCIAGIRTVCLSENKIFFRYHKIVIRNVCERSLHIATANINITNTSHF